MGPSFTRREFLQFGTASAPLALAGCRRSQAFIGARAEKLREVVLKNTISRPFQVQIEVLRNGKTAQEYTYKLASIDKRGKHKVIMDDWKGNCEARNWRVRARTSDSSWEDAELDASRDTNCHTVHIETGDWAESPILVLPRTCSEDTGC